MDIATLASPLSWAVTEVVASLVNTSGFWMLTRVAQTFIHGVNFAVDS